MTSLSVSMNAALSSLKTIQTQLTLASTNISNADTDGYTTKSATLSSTSSNGVGTGVTISAVTSDVDQYLLKSITKATTAYGAASTTSDYLSQLSDALGSLSTDDDSDTTVASLLSDVETALTSLASSSDDETLQNQAVLNLVDACTMIRDTSSAIQTLRTQADQQISDDVDTVNQALEQIKELNTQIVTTTAKGESTADLEDQRNELVQTIASKLGINYYTDSSGAMTIYTSSGQVLLDSSVHELSHTAVHTSSSSTTYDEITVNGVDITSNLTSGEIGALVTLRDDTLSSVQSNLDTLATDIADALNAVSNEGTSNPPPNTLTGTTAVSATDSLSASGTLYVVVTDEDGSTVSSDSIDLSAITSVQELEDALNAVSGLSATIDSNGYLVLSATDSSDGVAISGGSITTTSGSTTTTENVSSYFGLNDLLTGDSASTIAVRDDIADKTSLLQCQTVVATTSSSGTVTLSVSTSSTTQAQALADALGDYTDSAGDIVGTVATLVSSAESKASSKETTLNTLLDSFSSQFGVNTDEETAKITKLQSAYEASAQVISTVQTMFSALLDAVGG